MVLAVGRVLGVARACQLAAAAPGVRLCSVGWDGGDWGGGRAPEERLKARPARTHGRSGGVGRERAAWWVRAGRDGCRKKQLAGGSLRGPSRKKKA
ncbi:MAG: hypothetical protein J3K34DRAFT_438894 [Monoraphidium minutum]|nr:MAG: hypothetical protein J3K34DRAFT_438894 [Monoraphidium minutum]